MIDIENVGSTAVPGLAAKPILDIDVVIASYDDLPGVVSVLAGLGYRHNGDQGIAQREAFKRVDELVPYVEPSRKWMQHHLYVCPRDSLELRRHILFRDALRGSPKVKREYESLKRTIAARSGGDRKTYARIKEDAARPFVESAIARMVDRDNTPRRFPLRHSGYEGQARGDSIESPHAHRGEAPEERRTEGTGPRSGVGRSLGGGKA